MLNPQVIALAAANWLFRFLLYLTATATAFVLLFGSPSVIERTLVDANAYQRFVPATIQSNIDNKQEGSLNLQDKTVQSIINQSFPPQDLQIKTELVVNSFYDWLNGKTTTPAYVVDFSPNIGLLADKLSAYAVNRVEFLPVCSTPPAEFDPFTTHCKPELFDADTTRQQLGADIVNNNGLLPKTVFTAHDLPKNSAGKTIVEQYPQLPVLFQIAKIAPILLALVSLLCVVVLMWLSRSKRRATHQIGMAFVSNGVFLCLSPILFNYVLPKLTSGLHAASSHGAQSVASDVYQVLYSKLNWWLLITGLLLVAVGFAVIVLERGTRPKSKYTGIKKKTGLISSIEKRAANGRFVLNPAKVPLQSSEISVTKAPKRRKNSKYRKIPRGE